MWGQCVKGGVGVVEIKRGRGSGHWHAHLHLLVHGYYIDQRALSRAWHKATGDSPIVDVRAVSDERKGAAYVCKYLGKGFDSSVLASADDLRECVVALSGRRLLIPFGDWYGAFGAARREPEPEWRVVGGLHDLLSAAGRGEAWAVGVLRSLRASRERGIDEGPPPEGYDDVEPPD